MNPQSLANVIAAPTRFRAIQDRFPIEV